MSQENQALVRRFYSEILDRGNIDAIDGFLALDNADRQSPPHDVSALERFKKSLISLCAAFPDLRVTLEEVMSFEDRVVVRWTDRGTHEGQILGMAPTGRKITTTGITIFRICAGRIVEQWTNWDALSLMAQLGALGSGPRDLIGRMLTSQEEERRRVAYEVHDGLAQTAVAAHGLLEAYVENHPPDGDAARKDLDRVLALVQSVVKESRRVIGRLRPTALDDLGLAAALRLQADALREEGWEISFEDGLGKVRVPPEVETALFRVAQEALTNARKHAGSTKASIRLARLGPEARLSVRDFGMGFDPNANTSRTAAGERVGLYGMRERVALVGGDLDIYSEAGVGTLIVARVSCG